MYSPLASCENKHHISLYVWEQSTGKKKFYNEVISSDMTVFRLPLHSGWTSTNTTVTLTKPTLYLSILPEAAAFGAPSLNDKG